MSGYQYALEGGLAQTKMSPVHGHLMGLRTSLAETMSSCFATSRMGVPSDKFQ